MESPQSQTALLALVAGDAEAFEELYDRYAARLYRAAMGMLGRNEDAEDAVQEVFSAVVRSRRQLAAVKDLTAYLFTILRNSSGRIAARRAKEITADPENVIQPGTATSPATESNPHVERLQRALENLAQQQREIIALKIDGELTFKQIGHILDINMNTAASRYRYALEKLRRALGGDP